MFECRKNAVRINSINQQISGIETWLGLERMFNANICNLFFFVVLNKDFLRNVSSSIEEDLIQFD